MVKAAWGTKRTCQGCGARFYDLNNNPIACPKCGHAHDPEDFVKARRSRVSAAAAAAKAAAAAPKKKATVDGVPIGEAGDLPEVEGDGDEAAIETTDDLEDDDDIEVEVEIEDKVDKDDET
ncbi:MAG: TIGR02300 family protein [Rhodospirillales bacterium]|nr:MAG: TIGR02300 family protein [Rhodospirillales bacterium]